MWSAVTQQSAILSRWQLGPLLNVANVALAANNVENSRMIAGVLGAGVTFGVILPYSRQHEYEADRLGADFMVGADYKGGRGGAFLGYNDSEVPASDLWSSCRHIHRIKTASWRCSLMFPGWVTRNLRMQIPRDRMAYTARPSDLSG